MWRMGDADADNRSDDDHDDNDDDDDDGDVADLCWASVASAHVIDVQHCTSEQRTLLERAVRVGRPLSDAHDDARLAAALHTPDNGVDAVRAAGKRAVVERLWDVRDTLRVDRLDACTPALVVALAQSVVDAAERADWIAVASVITGAIADVLATTSAHGAQQRDHGRYAVCALAALWTASPGNDNDAALRHGVVGVVDALYARLEPTPLALLVELSALYVRRAVVAAPRAPRTARRRAVAMWLAALAGGRHMAECAPLIQCAAGASAPLPTMRLCAWLSQLRVLIDAAPWLDTAAVRQWDTLFYANAPASRRTLMLMRCFEHGGENNPIDDALTRLPLSALVRHLRATLPTMSATS